MHRFALQRLRLCQLEETFEASLLIEGHETTLPLLHRLKWSYLRREIQVTREVALLSDLLVYSELLNIQQ